MIHIEEHKGWAIVYDPEKATFVARKGRRTLKASDRGYRDASVADVRELVDAEIIRLNRKEKRKGLPELIFCEWRNDLETEETLINYTCQGLRLKSGKRDVRYGEGRALRIVKGSADTSLLHHAVEGVRAANTAMKSALDKFTVVVKPCHSSSFSPEEFAEAEDKLRATIQEINES